MSFRRYILNMVLPLVMILVGADLLVLLATERLETARFRERYLVGQGEILTAYLADDPEQPGVLTPAWEELERIQAHWSNFMTGFRVAVYPVDRSQAPLLQYGQIASLPPEAWQFSDLTETGRVLPAGGVFDEKALFLRPVQVGGVPALLVIEGSNPWHAFAEVDFWTRTARLYLLIAGGAALIIFIFVQFIGGEISRMQEKLLGFAESYKRLPTDTSGSSFRLKDLADLSDTVDHLGEAFQSVDESTSCLFLDVASTMSETDSAALLLHEQGLVGAIEWGEWQVAIAAQDEDEYSFAWIKQAGEGFLACSGKFNTIESALEKARSQVALMELLQVSMASLSSEQVCNTGALFDLADLRVYYADFAECHFAVFESRGGEPCDSTANFSLDPHSPDPIVILHPPSEMGHNPLMLETLSKLSVKAMAKALLASSTSKTEIESCLILRARQK